MYQSFDDCTKSTNYNRYNRRFHVPQFVCFFSPLARSRYLSFFLFFSFSFNFTLWATNSTILQVLFFLFFSYFFCVDYYKVWSSGLDYYSLRVFHTCISWWFFTGIWVTASLLKSLRLHYYYYYYSLIRAFHISARRWFFTGVWAAESLLKSPGLFSVFWPFSIMLSFGWSPPARQLPSPPVPLVIL